MKKIFTTSFLLLLLCAQSHAQSFRKGSLVVSISEGATNGRFTNKDMATNQEVRDGNVGGDRDPLTIEYGVTDKWGIGINSGADIHHMSSAFYNLPIAAKKMDVLTSELTFDINYHFFVSDRTDLSAFGSAGMSSVFFKNIGDGDRKYEYNASGTIVRVGAKAKYYVFKRFGFLGMVSAYKSNCTPNVRKTSAEASSISTNIVGTALEFGLCYRFLK
jgi:hypothetical protein